MAVLSCPISMWFLIMYSLSFSMRLLVEVTFDITLRVRRYNLHTFVLRMISLRLRMGQKVRLRVFWMWWMDLAKCLDFLSIMLSLLSMRMVRAHYLFKGLQQKWGWKLESCRFGILVYRLPTKLSLRWITNHCLTKFARPCWVGRIRHLCWPSAAASVSHS